MPRAKSKTPKKRGLSTVFCDEVHSESRKRFNQPQEDGFQIHMSASDYPYKLGYFILTLDKIHDNIASDVSLKFEPDTKSCSLHWKEIDETNKIQEKSCPATCKTPFEILHCLSAVKIFYFIIHTNTLAPGDNVLHIYINPSTFVEIKYASEPYINRHKSKLHKILQFFLKIEFEEYEDCYISDEAQVQKLYRSICNSYNLEFPHTSLSHDYLIPSLRKYQMQAVHWMLNQEMKNSIPETELHVLYARLTLQDGSDIFFHKYGGYFVSQRFGADKPCKGGILADEMGLGKTLEVLACILKNPRGDIIKQHNGLSLSAKPADHTTSTDHSSEKKKEYKISFSEDSEGGSPTHLSKLQLIEDSHFECVCGCLDYLFGSKSLVECERCHVLQHAECVLYKYDVSDGEYICPHCWINRPALLQSPATLIVSPSAIIYQWEQEISRHIKNNCLKVFMYLGVEFQKFVDPKFLANHDIVLTSYETFKKELDHANIQSGGSGPVLRHPKKFMSIPSPLCTIQWWRICLDEAQMVESVASKISKMAAKLHSVNRWCITGTPIQKSVEDLYGLLLFLGFSPYQERLWWKEVLCKPFINGNMSNINFVLKQIAWRTTKEQVSDQIGLPGLQEVIHKVDFSPIEKVFYEKQHASYRKDFIDKVEKFDVLDIKLRSIDKNFLSKLLLPLRKLQQVCCHFQISHGSLFDIQKNKMTMQELLAHLLKSTKYECEDIHRKSIMSMNGLAGIYVIQRDFENAIGTYEKVLNSIEDSTSIIRTDVTQQIHTLFHLSKVLLMPALKDDGQTIKSNFKPQQLDGKMKGLCETYIVKYKSAVELCKKNIVEVSKEISLIMNNFKMSRAEFPTSPWWCEVFESVEEDQLRFFFDKLKDILKTSSGKSYLRAENSMIDSLQKGIFLATLFEKSKDLHDTRLMLKSKMECISVEPIASVMESAISCHLRPSTEKKSKCEYCETEDIFKSYETKLFRFDESKENSDEDNICFQTLRRGTHADCELELVLKWILNYCRRHQDLIECVDDGVSELKLMEAMKKEFKYLRALWLRCSEYVSQKDEIEMAKISARVLLPGELPPNPPLPYILFSHEVQPKLIQYHSDIISIQFELKKKMGQLFYLQNLEKAENKDGPLDESCPVCRQKLENTWSVLQCGHSFCLICIQQLLSCLHKFTNNLGFTLDGICCPLCREFTACSDVYYIDNSNKMDDQNDIPIKGSYSAKVIAIIRCLLSISKNDQSAKSLVFTSFTDFLYILEHALLENDIKCLNLSKKKYFKNRLESFKRSTDVNVLLIPLAFGCNGLNITEATHVLLVEPVLDYSKHLQAIGRIHRIGQTRLATVHKFIISTSIDENIHIINKNFSSFDIHSKPDLTLRDLKHLFES